MGMFDTIRCKYPLHIPEANDLVYQTKDLPDRCMNHYTIEDDRTLWVTNTIRSSFTGDITFYSTLDEEFIEYYARFIDGLMIDIKLLNHGDHAPDSLIKPTKNILNISEMDAGNGCKLWYIETKNGVVTIPRSNDPADKRPLRQTRLENILTMFCEDWLNNRLTNKSHYEEFVPMIESVIPVNWRKDDNWKKIVEFIRKSNDV